MSNAPRLFFIATAVTLTSFIYLQMGAPEAKTTLIPADVSAAEPSGVGDADPVASAPSAALSDASLVAVGPLPDHIDAIEEAIAGGFSASGQTATPVSRVRPAVSITWADVEPVAYDAFLGGGFGREGLVDDWCDLSEQGEMGLDYSDPGLNPDEKDLPPYVTAELDALAEAHLLVMRNHAEYAAEVLQKEMLNLWDRGEVVAEPMTALGPVDTAQRLQDRALKLGRHSYVDSLTWGGWNVSMVVDSNSAPAFGKAMDALEAAKRTRRDALANVIAGL